MKIYISIEDKGINEMKVVSNPSFEILMKMREAGDGTFAVECALFALVKILDAVKQARVNKKLIIPPNGGMN